MLQAVNKRTELYQLVLVSWYTDARISEIFNCKFKIRDKIEVLRFAEDGGKTEAAKRFVPIHPALSKILKNIT